MEQPPRHAWRITAVLFAAPCLASAALIATSTVGAIRAMLALPPLGFLARWVRSERRIAILLILFAAAAAPATGLGFEVGAIGAVGPAFAGGSYLDQKALLLSEWGATSFSSPGSTQVDLFPELSGGLYAEVDLLDWIGVRIEPRYAFFGASRRALTDAGVEFDHYGLYFSSVLVPILARGRLAIGPGHLMASAGPFLGLVVGPVSVADNYGTSSTMAAITVAFSDSAFWGISGGLGYSLPLGPGVSSVELRADWALSPIARAALGNEVTMVGITLAVSYGMRLGGVTQ
jgi:hypothetical protein